MRLLQLFKLRVTVRFLSSLLLLHDPAFEPMALYHLRPPDGVSVKYPAGGPGLPSCDEPGGGERQSSHGVPGGFGGKEPLLQAAV